MAAGGAVLFWRERRTAAGGYNIVLDVVLPVVAIVICGYRVVIGVIVLLWLRARSPDRVRRFGQALDEGETV